MNDPANRLVDQIVAQTGGRWGQNLRRDHNDGETGALWSRNFRMDSLLDRAIEKA